MRGPKVTFCIVSECSEGAQIDSRTTILTRDDLCVARIETEETMQALEEHLAFIATELQRIARKT